jgi:hypothetical protein
VLHSFKKAKNPGPNRWTAKFYFGFYDFLEEELLRVIKESRSFGKIMGTLKEELLR